MTAPLDPIAPITNSAPSQDAIVVEDWRPLENITHTPPQAVDFPAMDADADGHADADAQEHEMASVQETADANRLGSSYPSDAVNILDAKDTPDIGKSFPPALEHTADSPTAFDLLHPGVQRWIWEQDWRELRDIQEQSIPLVLQRTADIIISAGTASGKTEAAFLPILSDLATLASPPGAGFGAIYVGPLRSLINDQFRRLEPLCDALEIPVVKWHSDAPQGTKRAALRQPGGVLLITPESLESMLIRRDRNAQRLFAQVRYIVIDELHAFLEGPRGRQLQSILRRMDLLRAPAEPSIRIGLSATLSDMQSPAAYLQPKRPESVAVLQSQAAEQTLRLQVRGYIEGQHTEDADLYAGIDTDTPPDTDTDTHTHTATDTHPVVEPLDGSDVDGARDPWTPLSPSEPMASPSPIGAEAEVCAPPPPEFWPAGGWKAQHIAAWSKDQPHAGSESVAEPGPATPFPAPGISRTPAPEGASDGLAAPSFPASSNNRRTFDTIGLDPLPIPTPATGEDAEGSEADPTGLGADAADVSDEMEDVEDVEETEDTHSAEAQICAHLYATLHDRRALVFAGSRSRVEEVVARIGRIQRTLGARESFWAHHGSLSREHREMVEARMRESLPSTTVATSTLEMGLDVGDIEMVAQLGAPHSASGMRQRVGRSGRRAGMDAIMRVYIKEPHQMDRTHPMDQICQNAIQAMAMANLMLRHWNEPVDPFRLDLSTLLHQILALIMQHDGITAAHAWSILSPVFPAVGQHTFIAVLRQMGQQGLLEQCADGTLLPGAEGERVTQSRDFVATFAAAKEFRVFVQGGVMIGTVPMDIPMQVDQRMVLAGRSWKVREIHEERAVLVVVPARGGKPPRFTGGLPPLAREVVEEMRRIYTGTDFPAYLDATASDLLRQARAAYAELGLVQYQACGHQGDLVLLPWCGPKTKAALLAACVQEGFEPTDLRLGISIPLQHAGLVPKFLAKIAQAEPPDAIALANISAGKERDKYDRYLGDALLSLAYAHERLDTAGLPALAKQLLMHLPPRI